MLLRCALPAARQNFAHPFPIYEIGSNRDVIAGSSMMEHLGKPEYIHVLLNPLPVYGLLMGWIGLLIAILLRSRKAKITALAIVLISAASAWPAYEYGEQAYDRVLAMTDDAGHAWLDEHLHRGEQLIFVFYALAGLSAAAIVVPIKWPKSSAPLAHCYALVRGSSAWVWARTSQRPAAEFGTANFGTNRRRQFGPSMNTIRST